MTDRDAAERVSLLTEAQREALRHYHAGRSAKEIGREIGVTHWAIHERLRSARRLLGVASSGEAARLLASAEGKEPYNHVVYKPEPVAEPPNSVIFSDPSKDGSDPSQATRFNAVREEQIPYRAIGYPRLRLPFPRFGGDKNDLTTGNRLFWIGAIALGMVVALGSLITISWGIVRMVGQVLRFFA